MRPHTSSIGQFTISTDRKGLITLFMSLAARDTASVIVKYHSLSHPSLPTGPCPQALAPRLSWLLRPRAREPIGIGPKITKFHLAYWGASRCATNQIDTGATRRDEGVRYGSKLLGKVEDRDAAKGVEPLSRDSRSLPRRKLPY